MNKKDNTAAATVNKAQAATYSVAKTAESNLFAAPAPTLGVKLLSESAKLPTYGTDGAACFDLYASDSVSVASGRAKVVPLGVAFDIPSDHVMLVFSRSGHAYKNGIRLANCVGVIDSDYRGEVSAKLHNDSAEAFSVALGDRVAQALLLPVARFDLVQVAELSETIRGVGGFGSTGK